MKGKCELTPTKPFKSYDMTDTLCVIMLPQSGAGSSTWKWEELSKKIRVVIDSSLDHAYFGNPNIKSGLLINELHCMMQLQRQIAWLF